MSKFKRTVIVLGSLIIFIVASLVTFLGLSFAGAIVTDPINLTYTIQDEEKTYDGTPLLASEITLDEGKLMVGHTASFAFTGSQTSAGESLSDVVVKIIDEELKDVTKNYAIKVNQGTLKVNKQDVTVALEGNEVVYSGDFLVFDDYKVREGLLVEGHKVIPASSQIGLINVGDELTNDSDIIPYIYDASGNDVSANYNINFIIDSSVKVTARPFAIKPTNLSKKFDGKPLVTKEYDVIAGSLAYGHYAEVSYTTVDGGEASIISITEEPVKVKVSSIQIFAGTDENKVDVTHNYDIDITRVGTLFVSKGEVSVSFRNKDVYYGDELEVNDVEKLIVVNSISNEEFIVEIDYNQFIEDYKKINKANQYLFGTKNNGEQYGFNIKVFDKEKSREYTQYFDIVYDKKDLGELNILKREIVLTLKDLEVDYGKDLKASDVENLIQLDNKMATDHKLSIDSQEFIKEYKKQQIGNYTYYVNKLKSANLNINIKVLKGKDEVDVTSSFEFVINHKYGLNRQEGIISIVKAQIEINLIDIEKPYNEKAFSKSDTPYYPTSFVESCSHKDLKVEYIDGSCTALGITDAGDYTYTANFKIFDASGVDVTSKYEVVVNEGNFVVKKILATVSLSNTPYVHTYNGDVMTISKDAVNVSGINPNHTLVGLLTNIDGKIIQYSDIKEVFGKYPVVENKKYKVEATLEGLKVTNSAGVDISHNYEIKTTFKDSILTNVYFAPKELTFTENSDYIHVYNASTITINPDHFTFVGLLAQHKVKSVITNIDGKLEYELTINPMNNYVEDAILTGVQIIDKNSNIDVSQNYVLPEKDVDKTIQRLIIGKRKVTFYIANVSINNEDFDNFQYDSDRLASLVSSSALALGDYFVADKTIVVTKDTYKMEMYDMPTIYNASGEDVSSFYEMANSGGVVTGIISIIPTPIYLELSSHTFTYEQYGDYTPYDYTIIKETNKDLATGTWELSCDTMDKAGTYTYSLNYSGTDANYLDIQIVPGVITVLPRPITATIDDLEYEYTGYNVFNSGDVNVDFSDGVYLNYTVENIQAINVDTYKYSISLTNEDDKNNYTLTENVGVVTVTPKEIEVELNNLEYEYTGYNVFNSGDVSVSFSEDSFNYSINQPNAVNVDVYNYSITITDSRASNYTFIYKGGNVVVTKKEIEVELNNLEYEYTGYNVFNPGDVSVNFSEDSFNYSINQPNAVNVDVYNYSITITDTKASNYTFTYTGGAVVVTKKTVTVTLNDLYYTYDGSVITDNNLYSDAYPSFSDGGSYQWEPMAFYAQERGTYSYTIRIVDTAITNINFEVTPGKVIIQ